MNRKFLIALMTGCFLLSPLGGLRAQYSNLWGTYSSNTFVNSNMQLFFAKRWQIARLRAQGKHQIADAMEGRVTARGQAQASANAARAAAPQPVKVPLSAAAFTPVGAPFMHKRAAASAEGAQRRELEGTFLELLKAYDRLLAENNELRLKNNLAGAFNFLFTVSYYALKDGKELNRAQQESMLEQATLAIALGLKEHPLSDREKQEIYESAVLAGMLVLGLYNEGLAQGQQEQLETARTLARDLLKNMMGIDVDKVRVTPKAVRVE